VLALLAAGSPAAAAPKTHRCPDDPGARCGTLVVPLDRAGVVMGKIPIRFAYKGNLRRLTPIVALAGGPGQAGVSLLQTFADDMRPVTRGGRAVIVLDQRGTGNSGLLRCRALEKADLLKAGKEAAACASKLGARRDYYMTDDTVADMDALRAALGVQKWSVYGVSYGTKVAAQYAQRYPDRVERLVLDSVVEPGGPDPLYPTTFQALPRVLGGICAQGLCRSVSKGFVADVSKLIGRLAGGALKGYVVGADGHRRKRSFGRNRLFATILTGDFDESLRAELPTAVRSALRGDAAPIIRLANRAAQVEGGGEDPHFLSTALYATTVCTEEHFPWDWNADVTTRLQQVHDAVAAIPDAQLYPFDRATVADSDEINLCSRWPAVKRPPPPPLGPLPDVPALLLSGQDDLRTPLEGAQRLAALLPRASLVSVPGTGHSVFGSDLTGCSGRALRAFFLGRTVQTSCKRTQGRIRPDGPIPASIAQVRPAAAKGKRGRTVSAATLTVFDVLEQSADALLSNPFGIIHGGGLRGGRYFETTKTIALRDVVFIPGVHVTGAVSEGGAATLHISGKAASQGHIRIARGRVTGVLGGRTVRGRIGSLSQPARAGIARVSRRLAR
jgi:pimeloyl-ACP methyl ester carboxylesterase